jgi:hypothetical protein
VKTGGSSTSVRNWIGFAGADISGSDAPDANLAAFRSTSGGTWQFCTDASGGGNADCTDTAVSFATGTALTLGIVCNATECKGYINGALAATRTTNLPSATSTLGYTFAVSTLTSSNKSLGVGRLTILHE